jgi:hypothetical protein
MNVPTNNSITAVDFPIHDYIPAVFMKITGMNSPWIFRLYILLYGFIGLYFLYKLAFILTNNHIKSIFILVFAATSPVFVYYQGGFLPTIPSLANTIIGIYFYMKFRKQFNRNDFILSIVFHTLAALSRTTFVIPLVAVFCFELLRVIQRKEKLKDKIIPVALSVLIIASYRLYNNYLTETYGSIFLSKLAPAATFEEAKEMIKIAYKNWSIQYFSIIHYLLLMTSLILAMYFILWKKKKPSYEIGQFWLFLIIIFIGYFVFAILMLKQFPSHDYYFLDTFFLPIIFLLIAIISYIPKLNFKYSNIVGYIFIILVSFPLVINALHTQKLKRITGIWDRTNTTINNFKDSGAFLDSIKIKPDAKILVIDAYAPNIPFILMNRKGYFVLTTSKVNIHEALKWNYDYVVVQDEFFISDIYSNYPEIVSKIKKIADNGKISICEKIESKRNQSLLGFLDLENKTPVFERNINFDTTIDEIWQNTQFSNKLYHSPNNAGYLSSDKEYGLSYKTKNLKEITQKNRVLLLSAYFYNDKLNDCEIVVSINSKGQNIYYKSYNLKEILKQVETWEKVELLFNLPCVVDDNYEFALYIWNPRKSNIYFDDFEFKIY